MRLAGNRSWRFAIVALFAGTAASADQPPTQSDFAAPAVAQYLLGSVGIIEVGPNQTGTLFAIGPRTAVTAAHVVAGAEDRALPILMGPLAREIDRVDVRVVGKCEAVYDCVLLEPVDPAVQFTPLEIVGADLAIGDGRNMRVIGFPEGRRIPQPRSVNITIADEIAGTFHIEGNVSPGDSGAPIFNQYHEVIGMVIYGATSDSQLNKIAVAARPLAKVAVPMLEGEYCEVVEEEFRSSSRFLSEASPRTKYCAIRLLNTNYRINTMALNALCGQAIADNYQPGLLHIQPTPLGALPYPGAAPSQPTLNCASELLPLCEAGLGGGSDVEQIVPHLQTVNRTRVQLQRFAKRRNFPDSGSPRTCNFDRIEEEAIACGPYNGDRQCWIRSELTSQGTMPWDISPIGTWNGSFMSATGSSHVWTIEFKSDGTVRFGSEPEIRSTWKYQQGLLIVESSAYGNQSVWQGGLTEEKWAGVNLVGRSGADGSPPIPLAMLGTFWFTREK